MINYKLMGIFKNKNKEPIVRTQNRPEMSEPTAEDLHPVTEGMRLNTTLDKFNGIQTEFLDDCARRGIDAETASLAVRDAIESGGYPSAVSVRERRDGSRELYLLYGRVPDGAISVSETGGKLWLQLGKREDGNAWPTEADSNNPEAFYVEAYHAPETDQIGVGDDDDLQQAQLFKEANDKLMSLAGF